MMIVACSFVSLYLIDMNNGEVVENLVYFTVLPNDLGQRFSMFSMTIVDV